MEISRLEAKCIGDKIGVDWRTVDLNQFRRGIEVEQEHEDVTHGDLFMTARIALAHLKEDPDYYTKLTRAGLEANERLVRENPIAREDSGLICMGRKVEFELREVARGRYSKSVKAPKDAGMLYDKSGRWWSSCSLLVASFTRGTKEVDEGKDYFGRNASVFQGNVDPPTKDLDAWHKLGEIETIYYDRAGTKHPGFFKHTFNKPRGIYKLIFLVKGKAAKKPAVLYTLFDRKRGQTFFRIELPEGCVVDDRGIVLP